MRKILNILRLFLIIDLILLNTNLNAQNDNFNYGFFDNWSVNLNAGNTQFYGNITNLNNLSSILKYNTTWSYGGIVAKQLTPVFGIRTQFIKGRLKGRRDMLINNIPASPKFDADYFEMNLNTSIDFFNIFMQYKSDRLFNLYGIVGIGLSNFEGQTIDLVNNNTIHSFGYGKGSGIGGWQVEGSVFWGGGAKIRLSNSFDINAEVAFKYINYDKLDGIAGGFKHNSYTYNSLGITYKFGNAEKKKKIVYNEPEIKEVEKVKEVEPAKIEVVKEEPKIIEPVITEIKKEEVKKEEPVILEKPVETPQPIKVTEPSHEFRVQVLASTVKVPIASIQKRYGISEPIKEDYDGTWFRYSVGSYQEFWKAKEESKKLISRNKVYGAFVVGYKDGKRLKSYTELLSKNEKIESKTQTPKVTQTNTNFGITYKVQVIALSKKMVNEASFKNKYAINQNLEEEFINNLYVYTVGNETEYAKVLELKNSIRINGITDAFIVTYKDNKRVSINDLNK